MSDTRLKILGADGACRHGGKGTWHLPRGRWPGKWMPAIPEPQCCERGYHLVSLAAAAEWLCPDCTIYLAEGRGASHGDGPGKVAWEQARLLRSLPWDVRLARLFAADCVERVLPILARVYPDDSRLRRAIDAARAFARGALVADELAAAEAAWAARAAAGTVTWAAWAARAAAETVTWAAWAAWAAERDWQGRRLAYYLGLEDEEPLITEGQHV